MVMQIKFDDAPLLHVLMKDARALFIGFGSYAIGSADRSNEGDR